MDLDLTCVGSFLVLADERHYRRASRILHLTPSALTKRVQRLELQLGVSLIDRGPSGVVAITSAGQRFLPQARSLISHSRSVAALFQTGEARTHGVRLGVPGVIGEFPALDTLGAIRQGLRVSHPAVRLSVCGIPYGSDSNALVNRHVDVMLTVGELSSASVEVAALAPLIRVGAVPFWHALADAGTVPVETFAELPILRHPAAPTNLLDVFCLGDVRPLRQARLLQPDGAGWSPTTVEEQAIRAGAASVCPQDFRPRSDPRMRFLELSGIPPRSVDAAFRRNDRSEPTRALIEATRVALNYRVTTT